jgi:hypothetical protein
MQPTTLVGEMATGLAGFSGPVAILIADRDRTGQVFLANWDSQDARIQRCPDATHSYVEAHARVWLAERIVAVLRG